MKTCRSHRPQPKKCPVALGKRGHDDSLLRKTSPGTYEPLKGVKFAMFAKAYSILRGNREKEVCVPLDGFFEICAPLIGVIPPDEYQPG